MSIMPIEPTERAPFEEYFPDSLGRVGMGTRRRRKPSRVLDAAIEGIRRMIEAGKPMEAAFGSSPYQLDAPVGRRGDNDRIDVAKIEALLGRTGYLDLAPTEGPTGYYGARVENALKKFQRASGLKIDGLVNPDGPTMAALRDEAAPADTSNPPSLLDDPKDSSDENPMRVATQLPEAVNNPKYKPPMDFPYPGLPPSPVVVVPRSDEGLFTRTREWLRDLLSPPSPIPEAANDNVAPNSMLGDRETWEAFGNDFEATLDNALKKRHGRRGSPIVREANRIVAEECSKLLKEWGQSASKLIEHVGGAVKDGTDTNELAEKYIRPFNAPKGVRKGSSYPDLAFEEQTGSPNIPSRSAYINSVTVRKDGTMTGDERRRYENLINNAANDIVEKIDKPKKGESWETYRLAARKVCQEALGTLFERIRKIVPGKAENKEGKGKP